jgi:hypothetical protein
MIDFFPGIVFASPVLWEDSALLSFLHSRERIFLVKSSFKSRIGNSFLEIDILRFSLILKKIWRLIKFYTKFEIKKDD